jgi:hypothetical protein
VAIKEEADAGCFDYFLVSDDLTSPAYIRKLGNRIVSNVLPWNTGRDKGTFSSYRIFAGFSDLVPHDDVLFLDRCRLRPKKGTAHAR